MSEQEITETPITEEEIPAPVAEVSKNEVQPVPKLTLLTPINTSDQIYTYQPMGIRLTLKLPFVSNDRDHLFAIRVNPLWYTPSEANKYFVTSSATIFGNMNPIRLHAPNEFTNSLSADDLVPPTPWTSIVNSTVDMVMHSPPPLITRIASAHRFFKGGLSYQIRTTSQFTNQANVYLTSTPPMLENFACLNGQQSVDDFVPCNVYFTDDLTDNNFYNKIIPYMSVVQPTMPRLTKYLTGYQGNNYVNMDLTSVRHAEITVPFQNPNPRVDMMEMIRNIAVQDQYTKSGSVLNHNCYSQWLIMGLKAGVAEGAGPKQIEFELYIRAEQDFELSGYVAYPPMLYSEEQVLPARLPCAVPSSDENNSRPSPECLGNSSDASYPTTPHPSSTARYCPNEPSAG